MKKCLLRRRKSIYQYSSSSSDSDDARRRRVGSSRSRCSLGGLIEQHQKLSSGIVLYYLIPIPDLFPIEPLSNYSPNMRKFIFKSH